MKYYNLETVFSFGKYNGISLTQVLQIDPTYLNWCLSNLDHFYIAEEDQLIIESNCKEFTINEEKMSFESEDFDCVSNYDFDSHEDFTDWSDYNDNLDMDQQSVEFWNQF